VTYVCPMHPDVVSDEPGRCPQCGVKLMVAPTTGTGGHEMAHDMHTDTSTRMHPAMSVTSSGKTTWSTSTGRPRRRPCAGG
jgi:hypothetical protein